MINKKRLYTLNWCLRLQRYCLRADRRSNSSHSATVSCASFNSFETHVFPFSTNNFSPHRLALPVEGHKLFLAALSRQLVRLSSLFRNGGWLLRSYCWLLLPDSLANVVVPNHETSATNDLNAFIAVSLIAA